MVDIFQHKDGYQMHIGGSPLNHPLGCRLDMIENSPSSEAIINFAHANDLCYDHTDESRWRSEDSAFDALHDVLGLHLMEGEEE